jgi:HlyD family secretion protein
MPGPTTSFLPTHRLFIVALTAAFFAFVAWAFLAQIDIVANAQGKLAPVSFVRVAQPAEDGVVRAVRVRDGQVAAAGDVLVEMDPLYAREDVRAAEVQAERLRLQLDRIDAELAGQPFSPAAGAADLRSSAVAEYVLRRQALSASLAEASAAEARASSDRATVQERLRQAEQTLPLVGKQARQQDELRAQGFVSDAAATDKDKEFVAAKQELAAQRSAVQSAEAAIAQARSATARVQADYRRQLAVERAQALTELNTLESDLAKKGHRLTQLALKAPVGGTVNGLASLAPGQVVKAGQALLSIVPEGERLRFEGWLRNEDAAYVAPGMPAKVKLAAYPFQKYGWVEGEVSWLGVDSETPDSMRNAQGEPLFYRVRIELHAQELHRDGQAYVARPGMQAIGDVQIGKRTLFEYLTSPVRKTLLEAAREK